MAAVFWPLPSINTVTSPAAICRLFLSIRSGWYIQKSKTSNPIEEIQHPAVRETLRFLQLERGLEIHHDGDLPARSGMGSSSSFTVGLLYALHALMGVMPSKQQLALESIHIEQNMIKETVGSQDQVTAAYGGLNHIIFKTSGDISVSPVTIPQDRLEELNSHLMLFYTGIMRTASDVAKTYVEDIESKSEHLQAMKEMVDEALYHLVQQPLHLPFRGTAAPNLDAQAELEPPCLQRCPG